MHKDPLDGLTLPQVEFLRECARENRISFSTLRNKLKDRRVLDELLQYFPVWLDEFMGKNVDKTNLNTIKFLHSGRYIAVDKFGGWESCSQQIQEERVREVLKERIIQS